VAAQLLRELLGTAVQAGDRLPLGWADRGGGGRVAAGRVGAVALDVLVGPSGLLRRGLVPGAEVVCAGLLLEGQGGRPPGGGAVVARHDRVAPVAEQAAYEEDVAALEVVDDQLPASRLVIWPLADLARVLRPVSKRVVRLAGKAVEGVRAAEVEALGVPVVGAACGCGVRLVACHGTRIPFA